MGRAPGSDDVADAEGQVGAEEGEEDHGDPDVLEGGGSGDERERTSEAADGVGPE